MNRLRTSKILDTFGVIAILISYGCIASFFFAAEAPAKHLYLGYFLAAIATGVVLVVLANLNEEVQPQAIRLPPINRG